jgi:hypothetical protein
MYSACYLDSNTRGITFHTKCYKPVTQKVDFFNILYRDILFFPLLLLEKTTKRNISVPNAGVSSKRGTEIQLERSLGSIKVTHFAPE